MKDALNVYVTFPMDKDLSKRLQAAANLETEGNRAAFIRRAVRKALAELEKQQESVTEPLP